MHLLGFSALPSYTRRPGCGLAVRLLVFQLVFQLLSQTGLCVVMESENEEDSVVSYKNKYRQLKSRLKYLIYVSIVVITTWYNYTRAG